MNPENKTPGEATPPAAEPKPFTYNEWAKDVPKEAWDAINQEAYNVYSKVADDNLKAKYGKYLDYVDKLEKNPSRFEHLKKVLDEDEYADYLFGVATEAYPDFKTPKVEPVRDDELYKQVETLNSKLSAREQREADLAEMSTRRTEAEALINDFPSQLKFTKLDNSDPGYKLLSYIIDQAKDRTDLNKRRGLQNPYVSARQIWDEHMQFNSANKSENPVAPTTSHRGPLEAPKSPADAMRKQLTRVDAKDRVKRLMAALEDINIQKKSL